MKEKNRILIVDDTPANLHILMNTLKEDYTVIAATNGEKAIDLASGNNKPDIILLDIMMPGMDGYETFEKLSSKSSTHDIPVIFVTAMTEAEDEQKGLKLGAVDYITKPFNPALVRLRIKNHLELKKHRDSLEQMILARTHELMLTQKVTIEGMATLAEYRDPDTGGHIKRTQNYVKYIAESAKKNPKFSVYLTDEVIHLLTISAPLHDIGKVGVPDSILLKPGKLDPEEFEQMKLHTVYGHEALEKSMDLLGGNSFLRYASEIALGHQEKWDGSGYPQGLKGEEIPLSARLMAIADVYDALISKRVYKAPFHHDKAVRIINEGAGSHFDPDLVEAFNEISDKMRKIALAYVDYEEERKLLLENMADVRLLIVEDQEINSEILKKQIESLGFTADVAEHGKAAMKMMDEELYVIVLTDIHMPEMNGYELLENIRKNYGKIPVMAVTGEAEVVDQRKTFRKGFDAYLKKPAGIDELEAVLGKYKPVSSSS